MVRRQRLGADHVTRVVGEAGVLGRDDEKRRLDLLLGHARNGQGGAVLLLGEPGIGKTALVDDLVAHAAPARVLRVTGYEAESTIPYAGLQRLCIPVRDHVGDLPDRQQHALLVAAGLEDGAAPDRFLVGLGVLGLLAAAAAVAPPLLCVVDDAHLLDPESLEALAFVARRIEVEPIAMVLAARDEREVAQRLGGVRDLRLDGIAAEPAVRLLTRSLADPIDPAAAAQIAQGLGGNPLALTDLALEVSSRRLEDLALTEEPIPVGSRLESHYLRRVRATTSLVQEWVLLAAADATGNVDIVRAAARVLALGDEVGDVAEMAGLVELGQTVRFHHPLVRSAVYNAATGTDRRRAHRALAAAAGELGLVELEAWHSSRATIGTDPDVADRLERAADLAAARGGHASRSSWLVRAAELTAPGPQRAARLVGAAEAALAVGAARTAQGHLDAVDRKSADPVLDGRIITVECAIALFTVDATRIAACPARLVVAADRFHGVDPVREQEALLQAFQFYMTTERRADGITSDQLGARLMAGARAASGPHQAMLRGMGGLMLLPHEEAVPLARAALDEVSKLPDKEVIGFAAAIGALAMFLWDGDARRELFDRATSVARQAGALQDLDSLLWVESLAELWGGTVRRAVESVDQLREIRRAMGYDAENVINASVMAWTDYPREVVHAVAEGAGAVGFGGVRSAALASLATRDLADGLYGDAYDRLVTLVEEPFLHVGPSYFPDFVEAAARSDHPEQAARIVADLEMRARENGSAWCAGLAARSRALVRPDKVAEQHYRDAIDLLGRTPARIELGRAHLVYGEWLRRTRRRAESGRQLLLACEILDQAGAAMFLPRALGELEAAGVKADSDRGIPHHALTPRELTIARLAGDGHTNSEIGAQLFISPNTVDYHLRKVFQKLEVSSRRQLTDRITTLDR